MGTAAAVPTTPSTNLWQDALTIACARIAPAWPLDRLIAASPYWGWIDRPIGDAADALGRIAGAPLVMPRGWYRAQRDAGRLEAWQIAHAIESLGADLTIEQVLESLAVDATPPMPYPLLSDVTDAARPVHTDMKVQDVVVSQIGRTCEAYFAPGTAAWPADRRDGLYGLWRTLAQLDAAARLTLGMHGIEEAVSEFPKDAAASIDAAIDALGLPLSELPDYFTALLMSIPGWASVCAHARWEARLAGGDDDTIEQFLAVRLGWELALLRSSTGTDVAIRWRRARAAWHAQTMTHEDTRTVDWVLQRAFEWRYQHGLARALGRVSSPMAWRTGSRALGTVRAQAVFCIDVRSEVMRRQLETVDSGMRTLGFAGFFGLPLAYATPSGALRPQLPGLLAPRITVAPDAISGTEASASGALARDLPSTFTFVEATGLRAGLDLLRSAFRPDGAQADPDRTSRAPVADDAHALRSLDGMPLDVESRAALAEQALRGMSLTQGFAPLVAFVGHGAAVTNNPQRAALNCGACGGQSGEMNARALAALLNDPAVRDRLALRGIEIPAETGFVGGVHDTVTDVVRLFPEGAVRTSHADEIDHLAAAFRRAGEAARTERAPRLGIKLDAMTDSVRLFAERANDWAEVRPEWGLARNAAFIVASRDRTRPLQLDGRAFLHEYVWQHDQGFAVLEAILTAPMVVAHWINAQYYASTVDPSRFGSGDKTLHNVVGGTLGVYEGAGGDLRTGLSMQSVHDGSDWVHEPVRLAVYVEAPVEALDWVIEQHPVVRQLVEHEWLHLFSIASDNTGVSVRTRSGWSRVGPRATAPAAG